MESYNGWNILSMDDMIGRHSMMSCTIGMNTMMSCAVGIDDLESAFAPAVRMDKLSPFQCPCCGGNKYKRIGQKVICEYCDTQFE